MTKDIASLEKIIVLDFGSQYNQLITRRIREFGVFQNYLATKQQPLEIKAMNPKGIIFSVVPIVFTQKMPLKLTRYL